MRSISCCLVRSVRRCRYYAIPNFRIGIGYAGVPATATAAVNTVRRYRSFILNFSDVVANSGSQSLRTLVSSSDSLAAKSSSKEKLKEKESVQCAKCGKSFSSKSALENHTAAAHPDPNTSLPILDKENLLFQCINCTKSFLTIHALKNHSSAKHPNFHSTDALIDEQKPKNGESSKRLVATDKLNSFQCKHCRREFSSSTVCTDTLKQNPINANRRRRRNNIIRHNLRNLINIQNHLTMQKVNGWIVLNFLAKRVLVDLSVKNASILGLRRMLKLVINKVVSDAML